MKSLLSDLYQGARNLLLQNKYSDRTGTGKVGVHALTSHQLHVLGLPTLTGTILEVLITDVSKWNGDVDFGVMRAAGVDGTVIKCGQGMAKDSYFDKHRERAKFANMPWSSYWFYDSRVHPFEQARLWVKFLAGDYGQLPHMADYEENYGGEYKGVVNFALFVSEFQRLSGLVSGGIGIYTGYYYWIANSNGDYNYFFKNFWLWLAWYSETPEQVIVPRPWTQEGLLFWQFTSNGDGPKYGSTGLDIDLNYYLKSREEFYTQFGLESPGPGETIMKKGVVKTGYNLNIRNDAGSVIGTLRAGDTVYGAVANNRIYFQRIYRADGTVDSTSGSSAVNNGAGVDWMTLTDELEPGNEPTITKTHDVEVYSDGSIRVDGNPIP